MSLILDCLAFIEPGQHSPRATVTYEQSEEKLAAVRELNRVDAAAVMPPPLSATQARPPDRQRKVTAAANLSHRRSRDARRQAIMDDPDVPQWRKDRLEAMRIAGLRRRRPDCACGRPTADGVTCGRRICRGAP